MRVNVFLLPSILALCIAQASRADEKMIVMVPAILDPGAPIEKNVKEECSVETNVGNQIFQKISKRFPGTDQTQNLSQAESDKTVLKATILEVLGAGGGNWSGAKSITIRVDVLQNAKVIGTRTFSRGSQLWFFGGVSGTCPIMNHIAAALGSDVAVWMVKRKRASSSEQSAAQPPKEGGASLMAPDKPASEPKQ